MKIISVHRQTGLSLLEILIAVLVLSVGLLGLAGLQIASLKTAQNTASQQQATITTHDLLERMRGNRQAALAGHYNGTFSAAGSLCSGTGTARDCTTVACSGEELAKYDLKGLVCASSNNAKTGLAQLINGSMVINCPDVGGCAQRIRLTLNWVERLETKTTDGESSNQSGQPDSPSANTAREQNVSMTVDARL